MPRESFYFSNGGCWRCNFPFRTQSLLFRTIVFCRFREEDKLLIAEIQLILTLTQTLILTLTLTLILTLTLTLTKINSKRRNYIEKDEPITVFRTHER